MPASTLKNVFGSVGAMVVALTVWPMSSALMAYAIYWLDVWRGTNDFWQYIFRIVFAPGVGAWIAISVVQKVFSSALSKRFTYCFCLLAAFMLMGHLIHSGPNDVLQPNSPFVNSLLYLGSIAGTIVGAMVGYGDSAQEDL